MFYDWSNFTLNDNNNSLIVNRATYNSDVMCAIIDLETSNLFYISKKYFLIQNIILIFEE
jgi:hypothetical protein